MDSGSNCAFLFNLFYSSVCHSSFAQEVAQNDYSNKMELFAAFDESHFITAFSISLTS